MATTTFLSNATVAIGAVDVSDQVQSVTLTTGFDQLETTAMGDNGHKYTKGLQTVDVTLTMFNSYGSSEIEVTLTIDSSPTLELIGVKFARNAPVIVYSGLVADSVVPEGEMVRVTESSPHTSHKVASISDEPYELNMVRVTSTVCRPLVYLRPLSPIAVVSSWSKPVVKVTD